MKQPKEEKNKFENEKKELIKNYNKEKSNN